MRCLWTGLILIPLMVGCPSGDEKSDEPSPVDTAENTFADGDADADTDADADADADTDSDTDADTDSDTEPEVDSDGDGVTDSEDPCPLDSPDDSDEDGVCDSDDMCPDFDDAIDSDDDGLPDACDEPLEATHDCVEDRYTPLWVMGWEVCIESVVLDDESLGEPVLSLLEHDLLMIIDVLPPDVADWLKGVRIWIELDGDWPGGVYHPSAVWLAGEGYPTHWAESIQLGNAANYLSWTATQPAIVLHELAHAWHHQYLGYSHPDILDAYASAMASGIYESVPYVGGWSLEAYATTNAIEYFAELTEAWFWENDFYPFVRDELIEFDPVGAEVVESVWVID